MPATRDLTALSESFPDMVRRYASYVDTAGKIAKDVASPDSVPGELVDQLLEALAHLAEATLPNAAAKVKGMPERAVTYFLGTYGERAARLKKAADAAGVGVKESKLRLVNAGITFAEIAHNPWSWHGTIVEARIPASTIAVTPIEPGDYFVVYAPAGTPAPKQTPSFRIVDRRTR
jgi:hypothetical protein